MVKIKPFRHKWILRNTYLPMANIKQMRHLWAPQTTSCILECNVIFLIILFICKVGNEFLNQNDFARINNHNCQKMIHNLWKDWEVRAHILILFQENFKNLHYLHKIIYVLFFLLKSLNTSLGYLFFFVYLTMLSPFIQCRLSSMDEFYLWTSI